MTQGSAQMGLIRRDRACLWHPYAPASPDLPLWEVEAASSPPTPPVNKESGEKIFKKSLQVMSSAGPRDMNRCRTNHAQHNQPEKRPG